MIKGVFLAGLVESILIAAGTTLKYVISGGKDPARLLNFVASGIFGKAAFQGGSTMAVLGLVFHVAISMVWAIAFFLLASRMALPSKNWLLAGIDYGVVIWIGMALVVLPLSKAPPIPFDILDATVDVIIIILCAGLPISFLAQKYNRRNAGT